MERRNLDFLDILVPFSFGSGDVSIMGGRKKSALLLGVGCGKSSGTSGKMQANPFME